jgi:hypothetical protein
MWRIFFLIIVAPFLVASAPVGDRYVIQPLDEQQEQLTPYERHITDGEEIDWTVIIVAALGTLSACVPAYFGYREVQKRKVRKGEE